MKIGEKLSVDNESENSEGKMRVEIENETLEFLRMRSDNSLANFEK